MTISNNTIRLSTNGDGVTTVFPVSFPFYEESDLVVVLIASDDTEAVQTLTTDYTVSGGAGSTGTITMVTAPAAGERLVRYRVSPLTQETDYAEGDAFPADSHEAALDRLTMQNQEQADKLARIPALSESTEVSGALSMEEPVAGRGLKWNTTADGIINTDADWDVLGTSVIADAAQVALDKIATAADVVSTNADAAQTALDRIATAADVVSTNANVVSTNADAVSTAADAAQTALDRIATAADAVSTAADVVSTNADAVATAADAEQTALDVIATAADVVTTSGVVAASSVNATAASTSASEAAASAAAAEAAAAGIYWKAPCYVATTANITLSGEQTIDSVTTSASRVLVKDQTDASENGIYTSAVGAWSRTVPMDEWDEFVGATVVVSNGPANGDKAFLCTVDAGGTLETTDIEWAAFGAAPIAISVTVDNFAAGVDFTAGSSTSLTLSTAQADENNIVVSFDGITQHHNTYTLSGTTVTFSSAIPADVTNIEVRGSAALGIGEPGDGTVSAVKIEDGAVTGPKLGTGAIIGTDIQPYDADTLKADTADVLTAGFAATPHDAGTQSSGTYIPDEANGNFQYAVNGGAHTLAPPTNNCTLVIQYTNNGSAGTITTSGFTLVDGDDLTTTDGHDFFLYITKCNGFSLLTVKALQ